MKELLHSFSGCSAVFFPVRRLKDGGTCEFATERCLRECAAFKNATEGNKIPYDEKVRVYKQITEGQIFEVCNSIIKQLSKCKPPRLLYWFACGDCPKKHEDRIVKIIKYMSECGVTQIGFTRNQSLWERVHKLGGVRFILTVEDIKMIDEIYKAGFYAVPNYKTGQVRIIRNTWVVKEPRWEYTCPASGWHTPTKNMATTYWHKDTLKNGVDGETNCSECYNGRKGCFSQEGVIP